MAKTTPIPKNAATIASNYYVTIGELSTATEQQNPTYTEQNAKSPYIWTPYLAYAPFVVSGFLFIAAFAIMVSGKLRSARINMGMFVVALFAAAIPAVLGFMNQGLGGVIEASPAEQPRNVRIIHVNSQSVTVQWETLTDQPGIVRYATSLSDPTRSTIAGSVKTESMRHEVLVTHLVSGTTYELEILSGKHWYRDGDNPLRFIFFDLGPQ